MQLDRRTFVVGTGLAAISGIVSALASTPGSALAAPVSTAVDHAPAPAIKVHGWDDEGGDPTNQHVWIGLNQQWRANWR